MDRRSVKIDTDAGRGSIPERTKDNGKDEN